MRADIADLSRSVYLDPLPADPLPPPGCRPARVRYMDWLLGRLRGAGFSPQLAYHAYHALDSHILGFTLWEAGHSVDTDDLPDAVGSFIRQLPSTTIPTSPNMPSSTSPSPASTTWAGSSSSST